MNKNFTIKHTFIEIVYRDQVYDIHNCYKLSGLALSFSDDATLEVCFDKIVGEWVKSSDPAKVVFVFRQLKHFEVSENFVAERSLTVEELGYKDADDRNYDWLLHEEHFTGGQHFIFSFGGYEFIRMYSDTVEFKTEFSERPRTLYL